MAKALMQVAEALALVLADAKPLAVERVPLSAALGRILAEDLVALRTQPPAALSAMDGYAVRAADVSAAPATLKLIGEVAAGHPFSGTVRAGEAARIFTGGVMPPGSDTVVIQEFVTRDGDNVIVNRSTGRGKNVRAAGIDFSANDVLLPKGRRLTDRDLMLAAAMNYPNLPVHRKPRIALLGTGDELVLPGSPLKPGEIVYSNGFALLGLIQREGAEPLNLEIARDNVGDIAAAARRARELRADVLVTTGGASVGDHDLVQRALAEEGLTLSFWRIALRPGRPMLHGRLGDMPVLGLPGNPVSAYVCAVLFLIPLIRSLSGRADITPRSERAILANGLPANDERADYLRATLTTEPDGTLVATPFPLQDSSLMAPLAKADCLVIRPPHAPAAPAGTQCDILKLCL